MAEVLIRLIDQPLTGDPTIDSQRSRRGDVVTAVEDGFDWGSTDNVTNPDWLIVKVPGMSWNEAIAATMPEPPTLADPTKRTLWKRVFAIDLDSPTGLPAVAPAAVALFTHPRTGPFVTVANADLARAILIRRAPIPDPPVIG